jgi:hypothetical protein
VIKVGKTHTTKLTNTTRKPVVQRTGPIDPVGVEIARVELEEAIEGNNGSHQEQDLTPGTRPKSL